MKILITGSQGFIGKQLSKILTNSGHEVRCTARKYSSGDSALRELITCDLESADSLDHLTSGCEAIVHLSGRAHMMSDDPAKSESLYISANVDVTRRLAQSAARNGVKRMILMSSVKVNGESTTIDTPFTPHDTPNPQDPYGRSKTQAEHALWEITSSAGLELSLIHISEPTRPY